MLNSAKQPPLLHSPPPFTNKQTSKKFSYLSFHHIIYTISKKKKNWWNLFFFKNKIWENLGKNIWLSATKKNCHFCEIRNLKKQNTVLHNMLIPSTCPYMYSWVWNIQRQICLLSWQWATSDGIHLQTGKAVASYYYALHYLYNCAESAMGISHPRQILHN
jgi:hypothetical protein